MSFFIIPSQMRSKGFVWLDLCRGIGVVVIMALRTSDGDFEGVLGLVFGLLRITGMER